MRRALNAKKLGNWKSFKEECRKEGKLCEWTLERPQVAMEDIGRLSIAQDILRKSADFLRRIIAPVDGRGGVTLSYVCSLCSCFPLDDYVWWVSTEHGDGNNPNKKHCDWVVCSMRSPIRLESTSNRILVVQIGANADRAKVFKAHAAPLGFCDNLVNALKLLANQQKDGDSPIQSSCNSPARKKQKRHHGRAKKL